MNNEHTGGIFACDGEIIGWLFNKLHHSKYDIGKNKEKTMKKKLQLIIVLVLIAVLTACGSSEKQNNSGSSAPAAQGSASPSGVTSTPAADGNILIAYFTANENSGVDAVTSASVVVVNGESKGISQTVAEMIAAETGGDLFSIRTSVVYPEEYNPLADYAAEEQNAGTLPELISHIENLDNYDIIFVGFPIWWYDMPQVMYSFFDEYDFSGKTIIPFTVHNGSRLSGTPARIQELEPDATVIQDGFTVRHSDAAGAAADVAEWLDGLGY